MNNPERVTYGADVNEIVGGVKEGSRGAAYIIDLLDGDKEPIDSVILHAVMGDAAPNKSLLGESTLSAVVVPVHSLTQALHKGLLMWLVDTHHANVSVESTHTCLVYNITTASPLRIDSTDLAVLEQLVASASAA